MTPDVQRARQQMQYRYEDLRDCGNDDDCAVKAEGALLAIDDFDYWMGVDVTTPPMLYRVGGGHDGIDTGPTGHAPDGRTEDHRDMQLRQVPRRQRGEVVTRTGEPNPRDGAGQAAIGRRTGIPHFGLQTLEGTIPPPNDPFA